MACFESLDLLLNKYINELDSEDKKQRKRALENIRQKVLANKTNIEYLSSLFEHTQKHLIRCFRDNSEAVRENAVEIVTEIIKIIPPKETYISNLIPLVSERLSGEVLLENSEEVRLHLIMLISELIIKYKDCLFHFLDDLVNIFVKTIVDPYPKVKKESCDCAADLAKSIPQYFHMQSESLIQPLVQTSTHQQYRIRVAAIKSIGTVMRYGNSRPMEEVCGPLAERLFDQHHAVRAAVAEVVGMWLVELPDRYSHFHRLIPLMLTCLTEEIPEQRLRAEELWTKAGKQYMLENETDLKDKMDYLPEVLDHYPSNVKRPNMGCRTLVQRELIKFLPAIVIELDDWKEDVRVKSAQLMCVAVQHAENYITQHLEKALPALYRACANSDARVSDNIERAAEMVGYFVPPSVYWKLMMPSVEESTSAGPLRVLAAVLSSSQRHELQSQLESIAATLASDSVCLSTQGEYQRQVLSVVCSLQRVMQTDVVPVTQQLFTATLSVLGLASDQHITLKAQELMKDLAQYNDITIQELYKRHSPPLLDCIAATVNEWTLLSPQRYVFEAFLTNGGPAVGLNISTVLSVLETSLHPDRDPETVLQMLMAISYILTHSGETLSELENLLHVIHDLCTRVLHPQLVWRAGRSAEALRTAAVACVVAALDLITCPRSLTDPLVPLLLGLVEDTAYKTRQFAILALLTIVKSLKAENTFTAQDITTIFVVVMKRLDDNNNKVRETAVKILCVLFSKPLPSDFSVDCHRPTLEAVYDTMLLHLDDPDQAFQDIMLDALKEISAAHPQLLKSRIQKDNFRNKDKCEQLLTFLGKLQL